MAPSGVVCPPAVGDWRQYLQRVSSRSVENTFLNPLTGKYHCPKCGSRSFSQSYSMYRHYRYECNVDARPRYQCSYCTYVSKWTHSVYNHVRRLHPDKAVTLTKLY
ncbi:hypothetical protein QAD02_022645 [Eretmocerus hayati]|uniref:Uncharacterized protein n=1 Tax=Eretmocerus hayati TaxID=131215 RepID=A0ACC2PV86_9HYME|nr:hypothetical protein QAD02_022645 [Eretmocerus hayati]